MTEIEPSQSPPTSGSGVEGALRFRRPRRMWGSIPLSLLLVLLLWAISVTHGISHPLTDPFFVFVSALALVYGIATAYLVARAPRELVVEGLTLVGVFRSRVARKVLTGIVIKRVPELLYRGVVVLDGGGERFVVFTNMKGFDAFMEAIRERSSELDRLGGADEEYLGHQECRSVVSNPKPHRYVDARFRELGMWASAEGKPPQVFTYGWYRELPTLGLLLIPVVYAVIMLRCSSIGCWFGNATFQVTAAIVVVGVGFRFLMVAVSPLRFEVRGRTLRTHRIRGVEDFDLCESSMNVTKSVAFPATVRLWQGRRGFLVFPFLKRRAEFIAFATGTFQDRETVRTKFDSESTSDER